MKAQFSENFASKQKQQYEKIANHMGTAREVVTRMLQYFQNPHNHYYMMQVLCSKPNPH